MPSQRAERLSGAPAPRPALLALDDPRRLTEHVRGLAGPALEHGLRLERIPGLDAGAAAAIVALQRRGASGTTSGGASRGSLEYGRALPLESVPNFSEGRDRATIDALGDALARTRGCSTSTPTPTTTAPSSRSSATTRSSRTRSLAGVACARERIDLRAHEGAHPRIGAADVVPIVPVEPADMQRAARLRASSRSASASELGLPVFLYGELARGQRAGVLPPRRARGAAAAGRRGRARAGLRAVAAASSGRRRDRRRSPAADRVQREPSRRPRCRARDRGARARDAAAASPACGRSGSTCRAPGSSR